MKLDIYIFQAIIQNSQQQSPLISPRAFNVFNFRTQKKSFGSSQVALNKTKCIGGHSPFCKEVQKKLAPIMSLSSVQSQHRRSRCTKDTHILKAQEFMCLPYRCFKTSRTLVVTKQSIRDIFQIAAYQQFENSLFMQTMFLPAVDSIAQKVCFKFLPWPLPVRQSHGLPPLLRLSRYKSMILRGRDVGTDWVSDDV